MLIKSVSIQRSVATRATAARACRSSSHGGNEEEGPLLHAAKAQAGPALADLESRTATSRSIQQDADAVTIRVEVQLADLLWTAGTHD